MHWPPCLLSVDHPSSQVRDFTCPAACPHFCTPKSHPKYPGHLSTSSCLPRYHLFINSPNPFAVRRSFSIPGAGFSCPANHPHHHTPRSHPECLDPLSISLNSRAHLRPTSNDTPNQFIVSWPKPLWPSVFQQPRRECRKATTLNILYSRRKHMAFSFGISSNSCI